MCLDDPKEFDELQVYVASKGISFVSMDNDNPKVFGDTSILKVLFLRQLHIVLKTHFALICTFYFMIFECKTSALKHNRTMPHPQGGMGGGGGVPTLNGKFHFKFPFCFSDEPPNFS